MTHRIDPNDVDRWVRDYTKAWQTNHPDDIRALFDPAAVYRTGPFDEPIVGVDAIVSDWLDRRDEPGTWGFDFEVLGVTGDLGIVHGTTSYTDPPTEYANLWLIRFGESNHCRDFSEWWIERPKG